jgi:hypothetical protein
MSIRKCIETILHGKKPDYIPFVIWNNKLPGGKLEEEILDTGAGVIAKSSVYTVSLNEVKTEVFHLLDDKGRERKRIIYHTPYGNLKETVLISSGSIWREEPIFKGPQDYEAIFFLIHDYEYTPCYEKFLEDDARYGEQGIARPGTEKSPFFEIIYDIMGISNFAVEWNENPDMVFELFKILLQARRKRLEIVAKSPAQFVVIDGNIEMSVIGRERFEKYYKPVIQEACELLLQHGKIAGAHLDGNNSNLLDIFAGLPVDLIESFTPPPDCDVSIGEALKVWPEKRLLVNFPSSVHLHGMEAVKKTALDLLAQASNTGRVMIGLCEDIPRYDNVPILAKTVLNYSDNNKVEL